MLQGSMSCRHLEWATGYMKEHWHFIPNVGLFLTSAFMNMHSSRCSALVKIVTAVLCCLYEVNISRILNPFILTTTSAWRKWEEYLIGAAIVGTVHGCTIFTFSFVPHVAHDLKTHQTNSLFTK